MYRIRTQNKYRNERTEVDGLYYDSKKEANYAAELVLRYRAKDIKGFERQVTIPLYVGQYHICDYRIDFVVHHFDGTTEYVEVKGFVTPLWRLKWKIFEALYSTKKNVRLTIVK